MGGRGSGRRPDGARRRQVAELRARGLSFVEIGRRLGVCWQGAYYLSRQNTLTYRPPVRCAACGRPIRGSENAGANTGAVLCPSCLAERPGATLGQRLESCRVSRGLSRAALGRAAGLTEFSVRAYETGKVRRPRRGALARLARALGVRPEDLAGG